MKIILIGYGKMGKEIEQEALACQHTICAKIDQDNEWQLYHEAIREADVAIDFSIPDKAVGNILKCFERNIPIVVGVTGWYEQLDFIIKTCIEQQKNLFYAPNFSIGMNIMFDLNKRLVQLTSKYGYQLELFEAHHEQKLDKPSGTALKLANDIIEESEYKKWTLDKNKINTDLFIDVIRQGDIKGIHEVRAQSEADKLTIRHEAISRKGFAKGAIAAASFLIGKKGVFTMTDLLNE